MKMPMGLKKHFWYSLVLLAKFYDIPSICYNYYNPETCYQQEFIRPSPLPTIYQVIPRKYFAFVSGICDILTAELMKSQRYLIFSLFLPADVVSIENLLLVLMGRGYNGICEVLLTHLSIFYAPLLKGEHLHVLSYLYPAYGSSYEASHKISLNITWFLHLNMFAQYSRYFYDVLYIAMIYLLKMVPEDQRVEIILLFKPSNYKSYLLHIADSPFFHFYLLVFILENYVQYLFRVGGIGNPNFINWCCTIFIGVFILERRLKILRSQKISIASSK